MSPPGHELEMMVQAFHRDGFCVFPRLLDPGRLQVWNAQLQPLLEEHVALEGHLKNRGNGRYYVTLPFILPWADAEIFEHPAILALVEQLVGADPVMCQLATDTPVLGSEYQEVHRDVPPLFPEWGRETPSFQLAVNFPLVEVTLENGPIEIARGTHQMSKEEALARVEAGTAPLEPVPMALGDVMVRDVRGLHRGTPNRTRVPRPMVVIGYSRRWMLRPEVSIRIPRATYETLSDRAKRMLRFNPVVEAEDLRPTTESYQAFAY